MKRGWKIFWIIVASITGLGVIFCCIALGLGLTFSQIRDVYPNGIGFIRDYDEDNFDHDDHWDDDMRKPSQEAQEFQNITGLKITAGLCRVRILPGDGDLVKVDISGMDFGNSGKSISVSEKEGILSIEMKKDGNIIDVMENITGNHDYGTIYVYIPRNLQLETTEMEFGTVEVEAEQLKSKKLKVESGAADCSFEDARVGDVDIVVGTGDFSLEGIVSGNVVVECGVGNVELGLRGKKADYNYEVECGVGSVEIGENTLADGISIDNGSDREMKLTCGVGNIEIDYEYD